MKRKLSLLIAIVMVLSLLPAMSVSARSVNTLLVGGGQVPNDFSWYDGDTNLVKTTVPVLEVKRDNDADDWGTSTGDRKRFTLLLSNAEWAYADFAGTVGNLPGWDGVNTISYVRGEAPIGLGGSTYATGVDYDLIFRTKTEAEVVIKGDNRVLDDNGDPNVAGNVAVVIPLITKMKGDGAASVSIEQIDSELALTQTTRNFATGVSGTTKATIKENDRTFSKTLNVDNVIIQETAPGTIEFGTGTKKIKLTAPSGFEWTAASEDATIMFYQGFSSQGGGGTPIHGKAERRKDPKDNGVIEFNITGLMNQTTIAAGAVVIEGLQLERTDSISSTRVGDVMVAIDVPGGTSESIRAGIFANRAVTITAEDKTLPEIISGVYKHDAQAGSTQVLDVTVTENSVNTWNEKSDAIFTLPDGVKFRAVKIQDWTNMRAVPSGGSGTGAAKNDVVKLSTDGKGNPDSVSTKGDAGNSRIKLTDTKLTFNPKRDNDEKSMSVKFRVWVTVKPGFTGDITFQSHEDNEAFGGSISAVVGKAIDPVTVTAKSTDVHIGYMRIPVGDITIKENQAGALKRNYGSNSDVYAENPEELVLGIGRGQVEFRDMGKVEVVSGDIVLDDYNKDLTVYSDYEGVLYLPVKRESTTASEIKLSGMTIDTSRSVPEGKLELRLYGSITANYHNNAKDKDQGSFGIQYFVGAKDYINVITAAPDKDVKYTTEVAVTIGASTIVANGVEFPTDAAAFIKDGYTMIPVRAAAVALGIANDQIHWDPNNKIVTIQDTGRGGAAQFQVGSNYINKNGMMMGFDGPSALVENGRTFLPFRALGEIVLNCPVYWEEATKTAYFNKGGDAAVATTEAPAAETTTEAAAE